MQLIVLQNLIHIPVLHLTHTNVQWLPITVVAMFDDGLQEGEGEKEDKRKKKKEVKEKKREK